MIICKSCKTENEGENTKCSSCEKNLLLATLECIISDGKMEVGTKWNLYGKDYTLGRSVKCDIPISGTFVSRHHCNLKYDPDENMFSYESFAQNLLEFEKQTYKILDGAIIPFPDGIELKFTYKK
jgi:FHA domain-containing protein